jgi:hypothetical protein
VKAQSACSKLLMTMPIRKRASVLTVGHDGER